MTTKDMTVGDLITALKAFDINMPVIIEDGHPEFAHPITHVDKNESVIDVQDMGKAVILCPDFDVDYIL